MTPVVAALLLRSPVDTAAVEDGRPQLAAA
jgi:hypothetical protein